MAFYHFVYRHITILCLVMMTIKLVSGVNNSSNDTELEVRLTSRDYTERRNAGLLEICHLTTGWGTVCDRIPWGSASSSVACRQLGFFDGYGIVLLDPSPLQLQPRTKYGTDFDCTGPEKNLAACTHNRGIFETSCHSTSDVWLSCNEMCADGDVQLVGSHSASNGKVEFCFEKSWWPICNLEIGLAEHMVACRQLGYFTGYHSAGVKGFTEFIFVRVITQDFNSVTLNFKVDCNGNESNISQCIKRGTSQYQCAGVEEQLHLVCIDAAEANNCSQGDIRLVSGASVTEGRLEICFNHMWGTVCNEGWDNTDAIVACRQLGFESASTTSTSNSIDEASGPIFITNVRCRSTSINKLSECSFDDHHITVSKCNHNDDVYLTCVSKNAGSINITLVIIVTLMAMIIILLTIIAIASIVVARTALKKRKKHSTKSFPEINKVHATSIPNNTFFVSASADHTYDYIDNIEISHIAAGAFRVQSIVNNDNNEKCFSEVSSEDYHHYDTLEPPLNDETTEKCTRDSIQTGEDHIDKQSH